MDFFDNLINSEYGASLLLPEDEEKEDNLNKQYGKPQYYENNQSHQWNTPSKQTEDKFQIVYLYYAKYLLELASARFEYKNLPDTIGKRQIENILVTNGSGVFFKNKDLNAVCFLPAAFKNGNFWMEPTEYTVRNINNYNMQEYSDTFTPKNAILLPNDIYYTGLLYDIRFFAEKIAEIEINMRLNITHASMPKIIKGSRDSLPTLQQISNNFVHGGAFTIITSDSIVDDLKDTLDLSSELISDQYEKEKDKVINEFLQRIGMVAKDADTDKITYVSNDQILMPTTRVLTLLYKYYALRKEAIDKVNEMFETNIKVEIAGPLKYTFDSEDEASKDVGLLGGNDDDENENGKIGNVGSIGISKNGGAK